MSALCLSEIDCLINIFSREPLSKLVQGCYSKYPLNSIKKIRKLLIVSPQKAPIQLIQSVIDSNVVPQIMKLLTDNNYKFEMFCSGYIRRIGLKQRVPTDIINCIDKMFIIHCVDHELQYEGRWILIQISSGTSQQTQYIVDNEGIPILMNGIKKETSIPVQTNSIQALGNIAYDNTKFRDLILENNALNHILEIIKNTQSNNKQKLQLLELKLFQMIAWTLKHLSCNQSELKYNLLNIQALEILIQYKDKEILYDVCGALNHLIQTQNNQQIQAIMNNKFVPKIIDLLDSKHEKNVREAAIFVILNMALGSDQDVEYLLNYGLLRKLKYFLINHNDKMRKDVVRLLSNITTGPIQHIEAVIKSDLFPIIIDILQNETYDIAMEALWVIANATFGTVQQIKYMMNQSVIQYICNFMKTMNMENVKDLIVILEAIENVLFVGKRNNEKYAQYIDKYGGLQCLKLWETKCSTDEIKQRINSIIKEYY